MSDLTVWMNAHTAAQVLMLLTHKLRRFFLMLHTSRLRRVLLLTRTVIVFLRNNQNILLLLFFNFRFLQLLLVITLTPLRYIIYVGTLDSTIWCHCQNEIF